MPNLGFLFLLFVRLFVDFLFRGHIFVNFFNLKVLFQRQRFIMITFLFFIELNVSATSHVSLNFELVFMISFRSFILLNFMFRLSNVLSFFFFLLFHFHGLYAIIDVKVIYHFLYSLSFLSFLSSFVLFYLLSNPI